MLKQRTLNYETSTKCLNLKIKKSFPRGSSLDMKGFFLEKIPSQTIFTYNRE